MTSSPTTRQPLVAMAPAYQRTARTSRKPQHPFNIVYKPFHIQPFLMAPVLPGETLKNMMVQAQCWSDPLEATTSKNLGWWNENFFFYVKHTDLTGYEVAESGLGYDLIGMFTSASSLAAYEEAAAVAYSYTPKGGIDFLTPAVKRIVEEYFRDDGEQWDKASDSGVPVAQIYGRGRSDAFEKLTIDANYGDLREAVPTYVSELDESFQEWAAQVDGGLIDMNYEDWMRTYGGRAPIPTVDKPEYHRPELIGYDRQFSYPTNTVDPSTGTPTTAIGWRTAFRVNKPVRFDAPGWIVGITLTRPKNYLLNQEGLVASMMKTRESWLPAVLNDDLDVSHLQITTATGPLATVSGATGFNDDYWLDLRDLLNYGEQFVNYTPASGSPFITQPSAVGGTRYPYIGGGELTQWFANTTTGRMRADGLVSLNILGRQAPRYQDMVLSNRS